MNLPEIKSYEDQAIDTVVSIINRAKEQLGVRQTLKQLAKTRYEITAEHKVSLNSVQTPIVKTSEKFICETIEKRWKLTPVLQYILRYMGSSQDECSQYYYFEAVFSQPTAEYPIPQATVSVFFRVSDKQVEPPEDRGAPVMHFRIEGQHTDHDVRHVLLTTDWILATIKMKIKLFKRIEEIRLF